MNVRGSCFSSNSEMLQITWDGSFQRQNAANSKEMQGTWTQQEIKTKHGKKRKQFQTLIDSIEYYSKP